MHCDASCPIGIFDSGVGGLTVARAVMDRLPNESIVYFGDTARVPYGVKSPDTVARYAAQITRFLLAKDVKLLIVACNTMAAVALPAITSLSPVPVIEVIDAGARSALAATRTKRIGIIATPSTIASRAYERALATLGGPGVRTASRACPLFVPLVEEGWLDHPATRLVAEEYLSPLLAYDLDTLILGCTHYPLLAPLLARVVGPGIRLQDSATAVAERAAAILAELGLGQTAGRPGHVFHVTDMPLKFREIGERFLGRPMDDVRLEEL
uniref:Glutamate racemase n=1 Tax=Desulfovibrio sp. U5L TaxID=596152 RepID=I2Q4T0_9BACT